MKYVLNTPQKFYGPVYVGSVPNPTAPIQTCLFCTVRWGWVVNPHDPAHWGILHQNACEGTTR